MEKGGINTKREKMEKKQRVSTNTFLCFTPAVSEKVMVEKENYFDELPVFKSRARDF